MIVALIGNPNVGKTVVFNNLTGARQHTANWPGVTVERKEGTLKYKNEKIQVVDLPGVYSLTAYSLDELIARNYLIEIPPDVVIDIVDASNIERNLYLTLQLLELRVSLVIGLNMMDVAEGKGLEIDVAGLQKKLDCTVIPLVAPKRLGMNELKEAIYQAIKTPRFPGIQFSFGQEIEQELTRLTDIITPIKELAKNYNPRWLAIKLLEGDQEVEKTVFGSELPLGSSEEQTIPAEEV